MNKIYLFLLYFERSIERTYLAKKKLYEIFSNMIE